MQEEEETRVFHGVLGMKENRERDRRKSQVTEEHCHGNNLILKTVLFLTQKSKIPPPPVNPDRCVTTPVTSIHELVIKGLFTTDY